VRQRIRRYAAVGLVATVVDVTVFLVAHAAFDQLVSADILALVVAALTSAVLHRWITLRNDPYVRWVQRLQLFVPVVIVAGAVDVVVLLSLTRSGHSVFWPKLAAVALAAIVRVGAHRSLLFRVVHRLPGPGRWVWVSGASLVGLVGGAMFQLTGSLAGPLAADALINALNLSFLRSHDPDVGRRGLGGLLGQRS
jgi:hypothetical protein